MKWTLVFILTLAIMPFAFAHEAVEQTHESPEDLEVIDPLWYFQHGAPWYGLLAIALWVIILRGVYILAVMVLGRFVVGDKQSVKRK